MTKYRLALTQADIELTMDCLVHATSPDFRVGRHYAGKMTEKTKMQLADLYQTVGQAMGEDDVFLEFEANRPPLAP